MRLKIGSGFGIPVYIHWTFLLLPVWILYNSPSDTPEYLLLAFTALPLIFACVVLHEFGHALAARYFGIGTHDVTLYPIGGVARLKRMSDRPLEEFVIAVAGPAVNVAIAFLLLLVVVPLVMLDPGWLMNTFAGKIVLWMLGANVLMVLFNLLPAFPMDGGRVLRALLASFLDYLPATQIAVAVGMAMAFLMALAGVVWFSNFMLSVIAVFVFFAGQQELAAARHRQRQRYLLEERRRYILDQDPEPPYVLPVLPVRSMSEPEPAPAPAPALVFQPKISVYTWDNQTGLWRKDP
jgi:Zn-dependent protease